MVKIAIAAAGTGGHIFPAKAVARKFLSQNHEVIWFGVSGGMEEGLIQSLDIPLFTLTARPVMGRGVFRKFKGLFYSLGSIRLARQALIDEQVEVVIVFGGYVSFPVGIAAKMLGIPVVIHEQNKIPGKANKLLSSFAAHILTAFPDVFSGNNVSVVGNPLRSDIYQLACQNNAKKSRRSKMNVLVLGGSLGAVAINKLIAETLSIGPKVSKEIEVWHQCGRQHIERAEFLFEPFENVRVTAFIDDMVEAYQWADVVIARAGALTVSECLALKLPALYIPLPSAIGDHQTYNARYAESLGLATVLPQNEAKPSRLLLWLGQCLQARPFVYDDVPSLIDAAALVAKYSLGCLKENRTVDMVE